MKASTVIERLERVTGGNGQWQACCPAHDDNRASLSIADGDDGRVLLLCQAGCPTAEVVSAMGLSMSDLFPPKHTTNGHHRNGASSNGRAKAQIAETYDYCDQNGALVFQAVRMVPKDFRQRKPDGNGGWEWSVKGCPVVPYHLPELLSSEETVFVVEGEKDVHSLESLELVATCNAGGAGKWKAEHSQYLADRSVVILPDNDTAGRRHAETVAKSLIASASAVKVVTLPGLPDKGDVTDWINDCHSEAAEPQSIAEHLLSIVDATPEWEPTTDNENNSENTQTDPAKYCSDLGNARRLVTRYGDKIRYVGSWKKWVAWDGIRWRLDDLRRVDRFAQRTVLKIFNEARDESDKNRSKTLTSWAYSSQSVARLSAMKAVAASQEEIAITHDLLDQHPQLLNCKNGTVDLDTGVLLPHDPKHLITQTTGTDYPDSDQPPKLWLSVLQRSFDGDQDLVEFLQRLCYLILRGDVTKHVFPIFHGEGGNGKTVVIEAIMNVLGEYSIKAPRGFCTVKKHDSHPTEIAQLFGKRFVAITETASGQHLDEAMVKELTGGDTLSGRRMNEDFWQFPPSHTAIMSTNHRPIIRGTDNGIWRRVKLVPFDVVIPDDEQDEHLGTKLEAEFPAILKWMVQGGSGYRQVGLNPPKAVEVATAGYRGDSDTFGQFIAEWCFFDPKAEARAAYTTYKSWCEEEGEKALSGQDFSKRMLALGGVTSERKNGTVYLGIGFHDVPKKP